MNQPSDYGTFSMINKTQIVIWKNRYNTEVLTSNLCGYNDVKSLVRRDITVVEVHATQIAF